jgi:hypothetical protein
MHRSVRSTLCMLAFLTLAGLTVVGTAHAGGPPSKLCSTLSFTDPVGDQLGTVDVTGMVMTFDSQGNYEITLTADSAHPFFGQFRVNLNLYNPDAPLVTKKNGFISQVFQAVCNKCDGYDKTNASDFNVTSPTTTLTGGILKGKDPALTYWGFGDRVAAGTAGGLGNPPGASFFRSAVDNFVSSSSTGGFFDNEDTIAYDNCGTGCSSGAGTIATISQITCQ